MNLALQRDWKELFALAAEAKTAKRREEETKRFYEDLDQLDEKKHQAKEKAEKEAKEQLEAATTEQLAAFQHDLDNYDTQTVHALMENGEALDELRVQLRQTEDNAHVLPDGRRFFKTQDGQHVFDEHGVEVGRDVVDPQAIGDRQTKWEPVKAAKADESKLKADRQGLLDYQARLDEARSRVGHGDMSKQQLDDLDADLKASAPPPIRQKLGLAPAEPEAGARMRAEDIVPPVRPAVTDDAFHRPRFAPQ